MTYQTPVGEIGCGPSVRLDVANVDHPYQRWTRDGESRRTSAQESAWRLGHTPPLVYGCHRSHQP
jgi:hypothetical protein